MLTGDGGYFVAGTDIAEMAEMRPTDHVRLETDRVFHVVRQSPKPVIAAVEGYALGGGCELALACDLIVAADDAKFGQPEIRVGIMPGAGGTQRLLRSAGRYKTLLWSLTGEMIPAREAFAANFVSELAPKGEALARSMAIAGQIAAMPPLAVQAIREAMRLGADVPLETALALERRLFERLFDSRGPEGRHAGIPGEAHADVPRALSAVAPRGTRVSGGQRYSVPGLVTRIRDTSASSAVQRLNLSSSWAASGVGVTRRCGHRNADTDTNQSLREQHAVGGAARVEARHVGIRRVRSVIGAEDRIGSFRLLESPLHARRGNGPAFLGPVAGDAAAAIGAEILEKLIP